MTTALPVPTTSTWLDDGVGYAVERKAGTPLDILVAAPRLERGTACLPESSGFRKRRRALDSGPSTTS